MTNFGKEKSVYLGVIQKTIHWRIQHQIVWLFIQIYILGRGIILHTKC